MNRAVRIIVIAFYPFLIMKIRLLMTAFFIGVMAVSPVCGETNPFGTGGTIKSECVLELGGNAFITKGTGAKIDTQKGLVDWSDGKTIATVYFSIGAPQKEVDLSIWAKGSGKIALNINGRETILVQLNSDKIKEYNLGKISIGPEAFQVGYQKIYLRGKTLGKDGKFGEVERIILRGLEGVPTYVKHEDNYWGRRGPSVHLRYELPKYKSIEYFYNELTVLKNQNPTGSYFMSNGFNGGYFGIQNIAADQRIVLFSVWSPFKTDNPKDIPEELKVKCIRAGKYTKVGDFGNEGSGLKTLVNYPWKVGKTYGFLTRIRPNDDNTTDFSAYLFDIEQQRWHFIATLRRPKTTTWHDGIYSFVENFNPDNGYLSRAANLSNAWVWDKRGDAFDLNDLQFSVDATGRKGARTDFMGYLNQEKDAFILKMGGFFNEQTTTDSTFERVPAKRKPPLINFMALERLN